MARHLLYAIGNDDMEASRNDAIGNHEASTVYNKGP